MKYVLHSSIVAKWYLSEPDTAKALRLRLDFLTGQHELLTPDSLLLECGNILVAAEQKKLIRTGAAAKDLVDLRFVELALHPSEPLLNRAIAMAITTRLTVSASLYLALAEREQCQFLTVDKKIIRNARKHFPFVTDFALLP
jgi:predicted nucleic acid-binding protein